MKKIFLILAVFIIGVACRAQLPSVVEMGQDSIRITRGEFVLRNSTQNVKGFLYNTGGGVTTFKRVNQINDTTYVFGEDTLRFNASVEGGSSGTVTASRGLHVFGNDVRWGINPLDSAVDIEQDENGITFRNGAFTHVWGDYSQATQHSIFENGEFGGYWVQGNGGTDRALFQQTVSAPYPVGEWTVTSTTNPLGSVVRLLAHKLTIGNYYGEVYLDGLIDSAQAYNIQYDPELKKLTYSASTPGGGITSLSADRGLHLADGNIVRWGITPLDSAVDIDQTSNGITFHDGIFTHGWGDYIGQTSFHNILRNDQTNFYSYISDGTGDHFSAISNIYDNDDPFVYLQAAKELFVGSEIQVRGSKVLIHNAQGNTFISNLIDSTQAYQVYINPTNWKITYGLAGVGGGGPAGAVYGVSGITNRNDSTLELGGMLDQNTTIDGSTSYTLTVQNSRTGANAALVAANGSSGRGLQASSVSGVGASITSVTGTALEASSTNLAGNFARTISGTNTITNVLAIQGLSSGTVATGFGADYRIVLETPANSTSAAARFIGKWFDASTLTSQIDLNALNAGVDNTVASFKGNGQFILPDYVGSAFDATAVKALGVDGSGNVVTYNPSGSSVDVDAAIAAKTNFDPTYFDGDGTVGNEYTLKPTVVALQTDITDLNTRIDSMLSVWPAGSAAGKTQLQNAATSGDTLSVKVNDSLFTIKRLVAGANVTLTAGANSITIGSTPGSAEINTLSITLSGTGTLTVTTESILEYVLVNPTTSLTGFKIGTVADDDYYQSSIPVPATSLAHEMIIQRYIPSSTAIQFSGITSSTEIDLIFKPIHR